jgi:hypothetical protein
MMASIKRIVLDVLKPHKPGAVEFSQAIASVGDDYYVRLSVLEIDENTETIQLEITAASIDYAAIQAGISAMGGSIHSVDEVDVKGDTG